MAETKSLMQWAKEAGMPYSSAVNRRKKAGVGTQQCRIWFLSAEDWAKCLAETASAPKDWEV